MWHVAGIDTLISGKNLWENRGISQLLQILQYLKFKTGKKECKLEQIQAERLLHPRDVNHFF